MKTYVVCEAKKNHPRMPLLLCRSICPEYPCKFAALVESELLKHTNQSVPVAA